MTLTSLPPAYSVRARRLAEWRRQRRVLFDARQLVYDNGREASVMHLDLALWPAVQRFYGSVRDGRVVVG